MVRRLTVAAAAAFFVLAVASSAATTAGELELRIVAETDTTITFGWDAVAGADGVDFYKQGVRVSHTRDGSRTSVRFGKVAGCEEECYGVDAWQRVVLASGVSPKKRPACSDKRDNDSDGKVDYPADPGCLSASDADETDAPTQPPPPPPPPDGAANLYVDVNGGSCTRSSSPVAYVDSAACGSFAAAYTAASSGDTVIVKGGDYGSQFFAGGYLSSQGRGTKTLTFKGEPGNRVRQIHFGSPGLTFDGINADARGAQLGGSDGAVFENGGEPFTFRNGSVGNVVDQKGALVDGNGIVFDTVRFHDVLIRTEGVHTECIFAAVPEGMVVRDSRFEGCAVMDVFFVYPDWWSPLPAPYGNVTLEGNWFGHPSPGYSLFIAKNGVSLSNQTPMSGWRVRNNYVEPGSYGVNNDQPVGSNNVFCGNTGNVPSGWTAGC